jgi:LysM repeat protein
MAEIEKSNFFHSYKNIGYTLYLSYLHPDELTKPVANYSLAGNVFACSRDKIDPALVAPEVRGFGEYELLVDDLEFTTYPTVDAWKGAAFASALTFTIKEPYGMSLLEILSAMHRNDSKTRPGGPSEMNYMLAPYCMTIEYFGYDTDISFGGDAMPFTQFRRQIPIILREVSFNLTASGAVYSVKAIPLAETPQVENSKIKETINFKGSTVGEMLTNFQAALNLKERENWQARYKDVTEPPPGPFVLHNFMYQGMPAELMNSKLIVDETNKQGKTQISLSTRLPMGDPKRAAEERNKRPVITNNADVEYTATAGQKTISAVILEIVMASSWFHEQYKAKEVKGKKQHEQPIVKIPKIFTYVQITHPRDPITNTFNRCIHYAIMMHDYLSTNSANYGNYTNDQLALMRQHKENKTVREYNYLFTGKNVDILNLDMKFNMLFYNALIIYDNRYGPGSQINAQKKNTTIKTDDSVKTQAREKLNPNADAAAAYGGMPGNNPSAYSNDRGGMDIDRANFFTKVRHDFEKIFDTGALADFQKVTMTIIGDPAYINDGLYRWEKFLELAENKQGPIAILADGTIDWTQDVFIKLNVSRPIKGIDGSLQYVPSPLMSRTYRIYSFKHMFKNGIFTQEIVAIFTPPIPNDAPEEESAGDGSAGDQADEVYQGADTTPPPPVEETGGPETYTIVKGDQLGFIAQARGTTVEKIKEYNPQYDFKKALQPGQVINLPPGGTNQGSVFQGYTGNVFGDDRPGVTAGANRFPRITRGGGPITPSASEQYPAGADGEGLI